jgi:hypothetical protein
VTGANDLMTSLRNAGFGLEAADGDGVRVWPADTLTAELRALIVEHKIPLIEQLLREAFEERAGIREFDGSQPRLEAEQAAAADLEIRVACLTCVHRSRRRTCLRPVEAGLTEMFEIVFCELLPEAECRAFEERAP